MKVLLINNYLNYEGGAESLVLKTGELLEKEGHSVYYYATDKPDFYIDNYQYSNYFPHCVRYKKVSRFKKPFYAFKSIYNIEAKNNLIAFVKEIKPDIAHVNSISFFLTPSVIDALYLMNIPIVMTMHNPYLVCPSVRLMCKNSYYCKEEFCVSGNPIYCLKYNCFENSFAKSSVAILEFLFRKTFKIFDKVSYFICPSEALKALLIKSGISCDKVITINNFISDHYLNYKPDYSKGEYFLYTGRLSPEKGLKSLIETYHKINLPVKLHIVGDGNQEEELRNYISHLETDKISLMGFKQGIDLELEYKNCISIILPTMGFETFGLSLIEGFAFAKPAIATNLGGISEVVDHNINGLLYSPDDLNTLANHIKELFYQPDKAIKLGKNARNKAEQFYNNNLYLSNLMKIYENAL